LNDYRLYRLDGMGRIADAEFFEACDDEDAIRQAQVLCRNAIKCEVRQGSRLVMALNRRNLTENWGRGFWPVELPS